MHELVHYFQHTSGIVSGVPGASTGSIATACEAWLNREVEAYDIQRTRLAENNTGKFMPSTQYEMTGDCSSYAERGD